MAQRYLKPGLKDRGDVDVSIGAPMGDVFSLAKEYTERDHYMSLKKQA